MFDKKFIFLFISLLFGNFIFGQDIETISKQKPFQINGGVGLNYTYTMTNDSNRVPMPSFWNINLNLNMQVYGISIPITAVITNGKFDIVNSFNQFGLSPRYKWLTVHGGYRQYSYSPFAVSGQTFLGGGIEARPWLIRLGFFIGRLRKAAIADTTLFSQTIPGSYPLNVSSVNGTNYYSKAPGFSRWGWGAKLGFGKETNYADFVFFKAKDRKASISDSFSKTILKPEENVVFGINTFQKIGKHVTFSIDAAASVYTYNTEFDSIPMDAEIPLLNFFKFLTSINYTSQLQCAGGASLGLNFKNFRLNAQYRRVEPYYRSMGITSAYSDNEMGSTQINWNVFKQKIRFSHNLQFQHDNLNKYKQLTSDRLMIGTTVSVNLNPKWGFDLSYNNFEMWQQKASEAVPDSIKTYQKSNNFTLVPRYIFQKPTYVDVISLVASYTDLIGGSVLNGESNHINNIYATLTNTLALVKSAWSVNTGLNYNLAKTTINKLTSFGIIAGVSKSFFTNQLSLTNSNTLLWNILDGKNNGNTYAIDLTASYILLKKHNFGCGFNYMYSPANGIYNTNDFNQFRFVFSYQFNF